MPAFPVGKGCIHLFKKCGRRETAFIFSPCDFLVVPANTLQAEICGGAIHNEWQPRASHKSSVIWVFFFCFFFLRASRISKMERLLKLRKFSYNRIQNWKWCRVLVYLYCIFGRQLYWLNENRTICYPTKKTKFCLSHRIISDELSWSPLESSVLTIQLLYDRFQCGIFHTIFGSCVRGLRQAIYFFFLCSAGWTKKKKEKANSPIHTINVEEGFLPAELLYSAGCAYHLGKTWQAGRKQVNQLIKLYNQSAHTWIKIWSIHAELAELQSMYGWQGLVYRSRWEVVKLHGWF